MRDRYLEITFRKGEPLAAYLYLSREIGVAVSKTKRFSSNLIVDYGMNDKPIGIEIITPKHITVAEINDVLCQIEVAPISDREFSPLRAA